MRVRSSSGDVMVGLNGAAQPAQDEIEPTRATSKTLLLRHQIVVDPEISTRAPNVNGAVDYDTVRRYAALYEAGVNMPPVEVWNVDGRHLLIDGFHRLEAQDLIHDNAPDYEVLATGRVGTMEEALIRATIANVTHGRPLTKQDRDRSMLRLLQVTDYSYRKIAGLLGVYASTVMRFDQTHGVRVPKVEPVSMNGSGYSGNGHVHYTSTPEAPATETPATEAPATEAPATEAPEAPATAAPARTYIDLPVKMAAGRTEEEAAAKIVALEKEVGDWRDAAQALDKEISKRNASCPWTWQGEAYATGCNHESEQLGRGWVYCMFCSHVIEVV